MIGNKLIYARLMRATKIIHSLIFPFCRCNLQKTDGILVLLVNMLFGIPKTQTIFCLAPGASDIQRNQPCRAGLPAAFPGHPEPDVTGGFP